MTNSTSAERLAVWRKVSRAALAALFGGAAALGIGCGGTAEEPLNLSGEEAPANDERLATTASALKRHTQEELLALHDGALIRALAEDVSGHKSLGYGRARRLLLDGLDSHKGNTECVYTGLRSAEFNIEHSWPQSLGAEREPARSDMHHLFVAETKANTARGNTLFGQTSCNVKGRCVWQSGGSALGADEQGGRVFQVRAERRGDIARAQFYFSVRYARPIPDHEEAVLRCWHGEDPPDDDERARNDRIEAYQKNRNPFIDVPELVDHIRDF